MLSKFATMPSEFFVSGSRPQITYGALTAGTVLHERLVVRCGAKLCASVCGCQRCTTLSLVWYIGHLSDLELTIEGDLVKAWTGLWIDSTSVMKLQLKPAWRLARSLSLACEPNQRWRRVECPISATVGVLLDQGWGPW